MVNNLPANARDKRDVGSILGVKKVPGVGNSSVLAWKSPWMEVPGGLQFMGSQRVRQD